MSHTRNLETRVRLAFYDASDGPRLIFFGPLTADFAALQSLFLQLSENPGSSTTVHELPFVEAARGVELMAICNSTDMKGRSQAQGIRRQDYVDKPSFTWRRNASGWDYLAHLIDSIVQATDPGHQYLTSYPAEDAIVVVSKGEYGDELLEE